MLEQIKDYAKCVYYNTAALCDYLITCAGITGVFVVDSQPNKLLLTYVTFFGTLFAFSSSFAYSTFRAYRRTKKHIKRFGRLDERFASKFDNAYCTRTGVSLAEREGLEGRL